MAENENNEILKKVLCGELNETDVRFKEWLEKDSENWITYLELKGLIDCPEQPEFDKEEVFSKISTSLKFRRKTIHSTFSAPVWQIAGIAAATVLVLAGGFSLGLHYYNNRNPKELADANERHFEPGDKMAFLSTGAGETINLSSDFVRQNQDGTTVTNKSAGVISYGETTKEAKKRKAVEQTLSVPKGGEYNLVMADGTKVYLNSETKLCFPDVFENEERRVKLEGEAFFEVAKTGTPFIVETGGMAVQVLGTTFNINTYEGAPVRTTLVEGSVRVLLGKTGETYLLKPSDQLSFDRQSNDVSIAQVNTNLYTSWVNGEFIFRNQTLEDLFNQLSRWYNFNIEYKRPSIKSARFTGSAEKKRELDYLLNQIQQVTDIRYKKEGDTITLY